MEGTERASSTHSAVEWNETSMQCVPTKYLGITANKIILHLYDSLFMPIPNHFLCAQPVDLNCSAGMYSEVYGKQDHQFP